MNEFLVVDLDSLDERLLEYLDEDDEMSVEAVKRLRALGGAPMTADDNRGTR